MENYEYITRITNDYWDYDTSFLEEMMNYPWDDPTLPSSVFLHVDFNDAEKAILFKMAFA